MLVQERIATRIGGLGAVLLVTLIVAGCGGSKDSGQTTDSKPVAAETTTTESAKTDGVLSEQAVGPGYPLVQQALEGATGPGGCDKTYNIWYVNPLPTTPDWGRSGKLFEAAAPQLCYKPTVVGPNKIDIPAMVNQIDDAISAKADAILTCSLDPNAFASVMKKARKQGIVIVNIACSGAPDTDDLFMGSLPEDLGSQAAVQLEKDTNGDGKVGIVMTDATTPNQVKILNGFKDQIKSSSGMKIVDIVYDKSDAGLAAEKLSQMLTAHPDINAIWTIEGIAPGAIPTALREAGKSPGDIKVLAIDLMKPTCKAIKEGWITSTQYQLFFDASPLAARHAIEIKNGQPPAEKVINTGFELITKDNIPAGAC